MSSAHLHCLVSYERYENYVVSLSPRAPLNTLEVCADAVDKVQELTHYLNESTQPTYSLACRAHALLQVQADLDQVSTPLPAEPESLRARLIPSGSVSHCVPVVVVPPRSPRMRKNLRFFPQAPTYPQRSCAA
jgi:hypothetical protein